MAKITGWLDDGQYIQRENEKRGGVGMSGISGLGSSSAEKESRRNILWNNFGSHHAFTTGRHQRPTDPNFGSKVRPKGPSQTLKVISDWNCTSLYYQKFKKHCSNSH